MTLFNKIKFRWLYLYHTWRVRDRDIVKVEIPTDTDPVIIPMSGVVYKVFNKVVLELELDEKWEDSHIDALATFMTNYPHEIDESTLLAFLHPEFYDMLNTEVEIDVE